MSSARRFHMPQVRLHGFNEEGATDGWYIDSTLDKATDVTDYVTRCAWTHSINAPWETIELELMIPKARLGHVLPGRRAVNSPSHRMPETGGWVVIHGHNQLGRDAAGGKNVKSAWPALAWGRVQSMTLGFGVAEQPTAHVETYKVNISCVSWVSMLQGSRLILAAGMGSGGMKGFVYQLKGWGSYISKLLRTGLREDKPGKTFAWFFKNLSAGLYLPNTITHTKKPPTIGGKSSSIPVIWSESECARFAPMREKQFRHVPGYAIKSMANSIPHSNIWAWLMGGFGADPNLVEIFPVLDWPTKTAGGEDKAQRTPISKGLGGAVPALMYRLKPYLQYPINKETGETAFSQFFGRKITCHRTGAEQVGLFQKPIDVKPRNKIKHYEWQANEIHTVHISYNEADRINGCYAHTGAQSQSQMEMYGAFGVPIFNKGEVRKHGLRMYDADWPFFPAEGASNKKSGTVLRQKIDAIIEWAWVCTGLGETFGHGSIRVKYRPWVKAGMWGTFQLTELAASASAVNAKQESTYPWVIGYIEKVRHQVRVGGQGEVTAVTELTLVKMHSEIAGDGMGMAMPVVARGIRVGSNMWKDNVPKAFDKEEDGGFDKMDDVYKFEEMEFEAKPPASSQAEPKAGPKTEPKEVASNFETDPDIDIGDEDEADEDFA